MLVRGVENGTRFNRKVKYEPTIFVPTTEETEWKSMRGVPVAPITQGMKETREFLKQYEDVPNFTIHGNNNFVTQYINDTHPGKIPFDISKINIATVDIEVASDDGFPEPQLAEKIVTAITIKQNVTDTYYTWAYGEWENTGDHNVVYFRCNNEFDLLNSFLGWWSSACNTPDVVTGWNSYLFDMTYLINRIAKILGPESVKRLSPWGQVRDREIHTQQGKIKVYDIIGVSQLDYLDLFKKFTFTPQESYKLGNIAHVVLGDNKLEFDGSLFTLYETDHQKFIDYNIKDVELVDRLEDKMGLIDLAMTMAYKAGVNYKDVLGTTAIWDAILYRHLWERKIAVPPNRPGFKEDFGGGYVKPPEVGMHDWVVSFDLNSLYPHLIMQYNMGADTIVDDNVHGIDVERCLQGKVKPTPGHSMDANGQLYTNSYRGIMPTIIDEYYSDRKKTKQEMLKVEQKLQDLASDATLHEKYALERQIATLHNNQMAIKILMNSLYGAMGNVYFRYYDLRIADGITSSGRLSIRWAENAVNTALNKILGTDEDYVLAIDTDSLYIKMGSLVDRFKPNNPVNFLDKVCEEKLLPIIAKAYDNLAEQMGAYQNKMVMDREVIAERGVWVAKKRYILNVWNSEGVQFKEPKLKMMGIEAVKSSTPGVCRDAFKDIFKILMTGTESEMQEAIAEFRAEFNNLPIDDIAAPRTANNVRKFYHKNDVIKSLKNEKGGKVAVPMHVRGACVFNHAITKKKLDKSYALVGNGDKIKYIFLRKPNPVKSDIISFPDHWPTELGLDKFVDRERQFNKTFLEALKLILDAVEWDTERKATLEPFFV